MPRDGAVELMSKQIRAGMAVCELCGGTRLLGIDHDHETGVVRGILCHDCNIGLGYFRDNVDVLGRAQAYLTRARPGAPKLASPSSRKAAMLSCLRCGWRWFRRSDKVPKVCPRCKSRYWNRPRTRGVA